MPVPAASVTVTGEGERRIPVESLSRRVMVTEGGVTASYPPPDTACDISRERSPLLSTESSTAVTVTVCAVFQWVELNVREEGEAFRVLVLGLVTVMVTSPVG